MRTATASTWNFGLGEEERQIAVGEVSINISLIYCYQLEEFGNRAKYPFVCRHILYIDFQKDLEKHILL